MGFPPLNDEQKQHIKLSHHALAIVAHDMVEFGVEKKSAFFNHLITNFAPEAQMSIAHRLEEWNTHWEEIFSALPSPQSEQAVSILYGQKKAELLAERERLIAPVGMPIKMRVNNENTAYLTDISTEDAECETLGKYIRALIEEYASKPYAQRERIYWQKSFEVVEQAIALGNQVEYTDGKRIRIRPASIQQDPLSMFHYLVGIEGEEIVSRRVARLRDVRMVKKSSNLTKGLQVDIRNKLERQGVQFIQGDTVACVVKLTIKGLAQYQAILHLRPNYTKKESLSDGGARLTFCCAPSQIEYYFFKFGASATVEQPLKLQQRFATMHRRALENYSGDLEHQRNDRVES